MSGPLPRTRAALGPAARAAQASPVRFRVRAQWPGIYGALL